MITAVNGHAPLPGDPPLSLVGLRAVVAEDDPSLRPLRLTRVVIPAALLGALEVVHEASMRKLFQSSGLCARCCRVYSVHGVERDAMTEAQREELKNSIDKMMQQVENAKLSKKLAQGEGNKPEVLKCSAELKSLAQKMRDAKWKLERPVVRCPFCLWEQKS
ncbi:unnamed protein product [Chrysoparadoxa australica]